MAAEVRVAVRDRDFTLLHGNVLDALRLIPERSVHAVCTSPPYWQLRDYKTEPQTWWDWTGELGQEPTVELYARHMVDVFHEVKRVLRDDGSLWLNIGETYRGGEAVGVPWTVAFALKNAGWALRGENIWHKLGGMPEPVSDRITRAHEQVFHFTKRGQTGFFDWYALTEPDEWGLRPRRRSVWTLPTAKFPGAHYAVFPVELPVLCFKASTSEYGCCADCGAPFRRVLVERQLNRFELSRDHPEYRPARYDSGKAGSKQVAGAGQRYTEVVEAGWEPGCRCHVGDLRIPLGPEYPQYACNVCGAPWVKTTRGETVAERRARQPEYGQAREVAPRADGGSLQQGAPVGRDVEHVMTGWEPSCSCAPEPIPCTVLDPFLGSGSSAVAARSLGLRCIGIELGDESVKIAADRLAQQSLLA